MMMTSSVSAQSVRSLGPLRTPDFNQSRETPHPGVAFFASAVIPGAGQLYQGKERWVPYLAFEVWGWLTYASQRSRGHSLEQQYRDLAWLVARRVDAAVRRDSSFTYYEAMAEHHQSGAYDADPIVTGLQPELDTATFNGKQWQLAKRLHTGGLDLPPGSPQYLDALRYYRDHAIPFGYGWSWGDSNLEQEVFNKLIDDSDDALRKASTTIGLILANHVVSAIDALVTARLQAAAGQNRIRVGSQLGPMGGSLLWKTTVEFKLK